VAVLDGLDLLVNCAGITRPSWALDMDEADFDEVMAINAKGAYLCCQAAGRGMVERRRGAIVNVASINALGGQSGRVNYTAAKAAMLGITRTLAIEWGRYGVRVNAVAPQLIETPRIARNVPGYDPRTGGRGSYPARSTGPGRGSGRRGIVPVVRRRVLCHRADGCGGRWPARWLPYRRPRRGSRFPGVRSGDGYRRRGRLGGMCRSATTFMIRPPCPNSMKPGADEGLG
jgi:NAD(P)-dependent dehydrogenase (short-subunit alcohol dehydrogenase family)